MSENLAKRYGCLPQVMGFSVDPAIHAAESANSMADAFGRSSPDGWTVIRAVRGLAKAQRMAWRAAPYINALGNCDSPGEQLGVEFEILRSAVEADLLAQNASLNPEEAARSVTPGQVAQSIGSVIGERLFAPESDPAALPTPLLRELADIFVQQSGSKATPADVIKQTMPSNVILKAAAPEILQALGFSPNHPMVASADRGGFIRGAGKIVAGHKLRAIKKVPKLVEQVCAILPQSGAELRAGFEFAQSVLGRLVTPQAAHRPN
jgi:hypothetical protein